MLRFGLAKSNSNITSICKALTKPVSVIKIGLMSIKDNLTCANSYYVYNDLQYRSNIKMNYVEATLLVFVGSFGHLCSFLKVHG